MKLLKITLIIFGITFLLSCLKENTIELQLTEENGYAPFESGLRELPTYSENKNISSRKTYLTISGIPENWTDVKLGDIDINVYQLTYQNYLLGNVSKERYEILQKVWDWIPDTLSLSKEPLKCEVFFAYRIDSAGKFKMIVDTNNNFNLSDEKIFSPPVINPNNWGNIDSLAKFNSISISYERFIKNKIEKVTAPLLIVRYSQSNKLMYNFPQYFTANLKEDKIAICSADFADLSYHNSSCILLNSNIGAVEKVNENNKILKNEYFEINGKLYKNLGVNLFKDALILEVTNLPKNQLYSSQVGFKSFPFEGNDIVTNSPISLKDFKGKYVLLDFWAIYCGPCIHEMPNLKTLYEKTNKSKFEIVGIIGDSPLEAIKKAINDNSITWPQILSNNTNKINSKFSIYRYPTTLLLNPEGIIVAKDYRGKELEDKIINLINE